MSTTIITAGYIVIGDEILSGRTKDKNIGFLASYLTDLGIDLCEVRVVPDVEQKIVEAINALRSEYTYVFTSGGIGPTHDDITADAVAKAFGVSIDLDPRAYQLLLDYYGEGNFNVSRQRMARIPAGADLIENTVSIAPGFRLENVHVMAGVPQIMQAMVLAITPTLKTGQKMLSVTIDAPLAESSIATELGKIQENFPQTSIGSYPHSKDGKFSTQVVVRSRANDVLEQASEAVRAAVEAAKTKFL
ncbi:putative competence-damage inducible protein [Pseudovibrio axinellae]|uniref:Putative competence-damage inducible protein n=1 Tax=Pseudovibrio axinellae TaxID=989403 RepID=A0A166AL46_9HYPH|nr:molybdopterin-binding protein [Pseudovibrio axinellae]KZL21260.1 putative competence-damage inducible protein [Pseudovibrio axinellae]SEQ93879.1 molybdenum cofactor synthesis domain-containing protein [Pseudovibrio axinellae]